MDVVLKPDLLWIGNSCYRVPPGNGNSNEQTDTRPPPPVDESPQADYQEDPRVIEPMMIKFNYVEASEGPCDMDSSQVRSLSNGRFMLVISTSQSLLKYVVGTKGSNLRRLEELTRANITVPRKSPGSVIITGDSIERVLLARSHIEQAIHYGRQKCNYTHFLSIPAGKEIQENFLIFKEKAQQLCPAITDEFFTLPARLHLTLHCLMLFEKSDLETACFLFNELKSVIQEKLGGSKLKITIEGLDIMNDDPSKSRVLFGKVHCPVLQDIAQEAVSMYATTGFVKDRDLNHPIKLHLTLINCNNAEKESDDGQHRGYRPPRKFCDFQPILNELKNFYFGVIPFETMELSIMGEHKDDGYYKSCTTMRL